VDLTMSEPDSFTAFIRRIRAGDQQAAEELVRQYEPLIRREVRIHLEDRHLSQLFDSMDISQSVLLSFFVRTAAGQYDLEQPDQLLRLLVTMTRNKLATAARRAHQQRRDQRRVSHGDAGALAQVADPHPAPGDQAEAQELLLRLRQSLSAEEHRMAELRSQGLSWADVAAELGGTAQARRMQYARAIDRVARELGIYLEDT
jgi:RNA polymerase sigma factor (sigma-70 family)